MWPKDLHSHYISWRQSIHLSYPCRGIQQLLGCRGILATCWQCEREQISQKSCAKVVSHNSKHQFLEHFSHGTGHVFWKLNQGPTEYRHWRLENYSNKQCISLLKCKYTAPSVQLTESSWVFGHLAHMEMPRLQMNGCMPDLGPKILSVCMPAFICNLMWSKKSWITTAMILLSKSTAPADKSF